MHVLLSSIEDKKNIEKKVVLISPDFFDLSKKIKALIEEEGPEFYSCYATKANYKIR